MARKSDYKYSVYDAVRKSLKADKVQGEGVVATILLETFLERKGVLKAAHVSGKKSKAGNLLISSGDEGLSFKKWRKSLEDLGWIIYDEDYSKRTRRFSDHQPGHKLKKHLNEEKARIKDLATMEDLRDVHLDVQKLQQEMEAIRLEMQTYSQAFRLICKPMLGENPSDEEVSLLVKDIASNRFKIRVISALEYEEPDESIGDESRTKEATICPINQKKFVKEDESPGKNLSLLL